MNGSHWCHMMHWFLLDNVSPSQRTSHWGSTYVHDQRWCTANFYTLKVTRHIKWVIITNVTWIQFTYHWVSQPPCLHSSVLYPKCTQESQVPAPPHMDSPDIFDSPYLLPVASNKHPASCPRPSARYFLWGWCSQKGSRHLQGMCTKGWAPHSNIHLWPICFTT